jgi:hypothetical protein
MVGAGGRCLFDVPYLPSLCGREILVLVLEPL